MKLRPQTGETVTCEIQFHALMQTYRGGLTIILEMNTCIYVVNVVKTYESLGDCAGKWTE